MYNDYNISLYYSLHLDCNVTYKFWWERLVLEFAESLQHTSVECYAFLIWNMYSACSLESKIPQ